MQNNSPATRDFIIADGDMAALVRGHDWASTSLGPTSGWSASLKMMVSFLLANRFPLLLWWGPDYISIYNDAYRPILGVKHPRALGQPVSECWSEIWPVLKPLIDVPFQGGPSTWIEDLELELQRRDFTEETHFTVAYSPVPDESAPRGIGGVLATVHEVTEKVVGERRIELLRDLGARSAEARSAEEACTIAASILQRYPKDIPFGEIYLLERNQGERLVASWGTREDTLVTTIGGPAGIVGRSQTWPLAELVLTETMITVDDIGRRMRTFAPGPWADAPDRAVLVPMRSNTAHQLAGVIVCGVSSRLRLDDQYRAFYELAAAQVSTSVTNARGYEEERRRAEALAEIDRAKTAFFSNVSHEFRTPLTLMLGPVEDAVANPATPKRVREQLELAHRNALRLQKLVNTLLDFSRIEAGRIEAWYEPLDLALFTRDLASNFRSAMERAGLRFTVECGEIGEPVHVDRAMWEKIVLNLLSNAFKFTHEGSIVVRLQREEANAVLEVSDSGVGIPEHELPRLFERFHRVAGTLGRTQEGSGIGLALVQELVRFHGGRVSASSELGRGSTLTVSVPLGVAHLPADRLQAPPASTASGAQAYVQEALRWIPGVSADAPFILADSLSEDRRFAQTVGARILLADDNADMRAYLKSLLTGAYSVEAVSDGQEALASARRVRPDLILSDIMMPRLNGLELLEALRADENLRTIPVILLSARAGEEARIEGLDAGADDYLIKPFSARELQARVGALLELKTMRLQAVEALKDQSAELRQTLDTAAVGLTRLDRELRYISANPAYARIAGRPLEQIIGFSMSEVLGSTALDKAQPYITRVLAGETVEYEAELPWQHAAAGWIHAVYTPWRESDGTISGWVASIEDFTARKRAEQSLRESEEQLRLATDAAEAGLWDVDLVNDTLFWPPRVKAMFGISPQASVSMADFYAGLHPEDREHTSKAFADAIDPTQRSSYDVEYRTVGKEDGLIRWVAANGRGIFDSTGRCTRAIGTAIDISERKRAEEMLRDSRLRTEETQGILAAALASTTDAVFIADVQGRLIHYNQAFATYHRFKSAEECSEHISECPELLEAFLPDGTAAPLEMWAMPRALRGEMASNIDYHLRRKESGETWVGSYSFGPIRKADGSIGGAVVVARDITEARKSEESLRARERLLRLASEAARIGAFELNLETGENVWSAELESMYGLSPGEFNRTQAHWEALVIPEDLPSARAKVRETLQSGAPVEHEWRVVWPDGSVHWLFGRFQAFVDKDGKAQRVSGVNIEITARKQAEIALQAADRQKDEFLAMLAHELRNPLAPISMGGELLARRLKGDADSLKTVAMIRSQVVQLTRLLDDLLDVSRITQGRIQLKMQPVDLGAVIAQAIETVQPDIRKKGHHLSTISTCHEPLYVTGDFARLVQCVGNILANAVKYTSPGGNISVRIDADAERVVVEVADNGAGISADLLPRVFELFIQSERTLDRSQGGLGIGLAVVRRLVQMHGGEVRARSAGPGQGSTFEMSLPRVANPVVVAPESEAFVAQSRRILIVDDNVDAATTLSMLLTTQGHVKKVTHSAKEALACSEVFRPDVGILDIGLPEISGYDLARELRANPRFKGLRLVALTGYGQTEDRQRALSAGFDSHLVKPVDIGALERAIADIPVARSAHPVP